MDVREEEEECVYSRWIILIFTNNNDPEIVVYTYIYNVKLLLPRNYNMK